MTKLEARSVVVLACVALAAMAGAMPAHGSFFLGDLVYCDRDANGRFDGSDYPIDGVSVSVECVGDSGATCIDVLALTGGFPVVTDVPGRLNSFAANCGPPNGEPNVDYVPMDGVNLPSGRYLVELSGCLVEARPWRCTVRVDTSTLPAACDGLVTPRDGGFPVEVDGDGKLCTVGVDGPFPEDQPLGNIDAQGGCFDHADPLPSSGVFTAVIENLFSGGPEQDRCALYNDFGYTEEPVGGPTRTPGFWKNHPGAIEDAINAAGGAIEFCGVTYTTDNECDAADVMNTGGGGLNQFLRHGLAGALNCAFYGCSGDIQDLIDEGSDACAAGDAGFDYGANGTLLDLFNNSGDDLGDDPPNKNVDKKRCN